MKRTSDDGPSCFWIWGSLTPEERLQRHLAAFPDLISIGMVVEPLPSTPVPHGPVVYFLQSGEDGPIKIGRTAGHPMLRRAELQTGNPEYLQMLMVVQGIELTEWKLHIQFEYLRKRGEWFYPDPDLLAFIAAVQQRSAARRTA